MAEAMLAAPATPIVTRDPRFLAGRKLIEKGLADEAVDIYATLLEDTMQRYGEASIETAPAYYEYGNTLLRAVTKQEMAAAEQAEAANNEETKAEQRTAVAEAAEKRLQNSSDKDLDKKPAAVDTSNDDTKDDKDGENDTNDDNDDVGLALEMMENSFSILEEYKDNSEKEGDSTYLEWVKEQLPRIMMGIGDTLSKLDRHADAADVYSRALELRKASLEEFAASKSTEDEVILKHLKAHRTVCEANVLIAEELLACPPGVDVTTTETQSLIVKAEERVSYARGYYDQARDALQEAVVFMGSMPRSIDLGREKEDVCFLATLVMGVGEQLAVIDEEAAAAAAAGSTEPVKKKLKTG